MPRSLKADGVGGGLILRLPVERIVVAAVAEVEETAGGGKEVEGGFGVSASALEDAAALARPLLGLLEMEEQGEPDGEVVVAEAAGTLLEVGLEMEDGVAVFGVAGASDLSQLLGDGVPLAQDQAGEDSLVKLLVERELAGKEAAIEGGEGELEVVGIETPGFLDRSGTGAGAETDVPHALNDGSDGFLRLLLGFFVGKSEKDIDIGIREEVFPSVAAKSEECDVLRRLASEGATPHFNQNTVDHGGSTTDGGSAVSRALAGLAHERHLPKILVP